MDRVCNSVLLYTVYKHLYQFRCCAVALAISSANVMSPISNYHKSLCSVHLNTESSFSGRTNLNSAKKDLALLLVSALLSYSLNRILRNWSY